MNSTRSLVRRTTLGAAGTAVVGVAAAIALSPQASATGSEINIAHSGTITTHLKTLNQDVVFNTKETTSVDLSAGSVSSAITPAPGSSDLKLSTSFGALKLATFGISIQPVGPATGTLSYGDGSLKLTQKLNIQITSVKALGLPLNLVPNTCKTGTVASVDLAGGLQLNGGGFNPFAPVKLTGTLDIPQFKNCGLTQPLLNAIASGPGNTVTIDLGQGTFVQ